MEFSNQIHPWVLKTAFQCFLFTPKMSFYPTFWNWGEIEIDPESRPSPASGIFVEFAPLCWKIPEFPLVWRSLGWVEEFFWGMDFEVFLRDGFWLWQQNQGIFSPKRKSKAGKIHQNPGWFWEINPFSLGSVTHHKRAENFTNSQESHGNNSMEITLKGLQDGLVGKIQEPWKLLDIPDLNSRK